MGEAELKSAMPINTSALLLEKGKVQVDYEVARAFIKAVPKPVAKTVRRHC